MEFPILLYINLEEKNKTYYCSRNESDDFESWYGSCFDPMTPPDITLDELLPSLLVYRWAIFSFSFTIIIKQQNDKVEVSHFDSDKAIMHIALSLLGHVIISQSQVRGCQRCHCRFYIMGFSCSGWNWQPPLVFWLLVLVLAQPCQYFSSLTFCLGVSGNILIILTVMKKSSFKCPTNTFLASLATADLLLIVVCLPVKVSSVPNFTSLFFIFVVFKN